MITTVTNFLLTGMILQVDIQGHRNWGLPYLNPPPQKKKIPTSNTVNTSVSVWLPGCWSGQSCLFWLFVWTSFVNVSKFGNDNDESCHDYQSDIMITLITDLDDYGSWVSRHYWQTPSNFCRCAKPSPSGFLDHDVMLFLWCNQGGIHRNLPSLTLT